jgi:hypothetical protein
MDCFLLHLCYLMHCLFHLVGPLPRTWCWRYKKRHRSTARTRNTPCCGITRPEARGHSWLIAARAKVPAANCRGESRYRALASAVSSEGRRVQGIGGYRYLDRCAGRGAQKAPGPRSGANRRLQVRRKGTAKTCHVLPFAVLYRRRGPLLARAALRRARQEA